MLARAINTFLKKILKKQKKRNLSQIANKYLLKKTNVNLRAKLSKTPLKYIECVFLIIILYFKDRKPDFINFCNNEKKTEKKKVRKKRRKNIVFQFFHQTTAKVVKVRKPDKVKSPFKN